LLFDRRDVARGGVEREATMWKLDGKVALVTGARRGIGRAVALGLARAGADVAVSDVSQEDCERVAEEIRGLGRRALAIRCDVSRKAEVEEMVRRTVSGLGRLDILINNAGIARFKPFFELSEEEWDETLAINLKGQFLCAQAAAREMVKRGWGRIVNVSSIASGQTGIGVASLAHYTASKGGVAALTEALAVELGPQGISVNAIAPGPIDTPMIDPLRGEGLDAFVARIPKHRVGRSEEVGHLAVFLSSEEADYVNGALIPIDGGLLAS
jgi:3-oxoacyl-[acyl-carrier protein] reductase